MSTTLYQRTFWILFAFTFMIQMIQLNGYLIDSYGFRQTQTAITSYYFLHEGFSLRYLTPVLGWPWSIPFEFPLYQMITALVAMLLGSEYLDMAGRIVSLGFYYGTLYWLYRLLGRIGLEASHRYMALILILLSPIYLFFSRTFMIESTALFFTIMMLYYGVSLLQDGTLYRHNTRTWLLFFFAGLLAALVKVTTFLVAIPFLMGYIMIHHSLTPLIRSFFWSNRAIVMEESSARNLLLVVILIMILALQWIHYTDTIKLLNPFGSALSSEALRTWNFGIWEDRGRLDHYLILIQRMGWAMGYWLYLLPPLSLWILVRDLPYSRVMLVMLLSFVGSFLLFFNLYREHVYYWYANTLWAMIPMGIVLATLIESLSSRIGRLVLLIGVIIVGLLGYLMSYFPIQIRDYRDADILSMAKVIRTYTPPHSVIYIQGLDWSSELPYYAQRRAIMIPAWKSLPPSDPRVQTLLRRSITPTRPLGAVVLCDVEAHETVDILQTLHFPPMIEYVDPHCIVMIPRSPR